MKVEEFPNFNLFLENNEKKKSLPKKFYSLKKKFQIFVE